MYYTHLELEKELGISKNAVDKRLKVRGLKESLREGNRKLYSEEVLKSLKESKQPSIEYYRVSCLEYVPYLDREVFVVKHFCSKTKADIFEKEYNSIGVKTLRLKWNYGY